MDIEIFTICDSAQTYENKLIIVGTFDIIFYETLPTVIEAFSIACRIRLNSNETFKEKIEIKFIDPYENSFMQNTSLDIDIKPQDFNQSINFVINAQKIQFTSKGIHKVQLTWGGKIYKELPITVKTR